MTYADMLDAGIEFQGGVRLCYYNYNKERRVVVDYIENPGLYETLCNQEIRYIYPDYQKEALVQHEIYIEVENPFEEEN